MSPSSLALVSFSPARAPGRSTPDRARAGFRPSADVSSLPYSFFAAERRNWRDRNRLNFDGLDRERRCCLNGGALQWGRQIDAAVTDGENQRARRACLAGGNQNFWFRR